MSKRIRIGTRGSKLALWQANFVKETLEESGFEAELNIIKTKGDLVQTLSFDKLEGKGFFTSELEEALSTGTVDLAVHSMKDLPTGLAPGLTLAGVPVREDVHDLWIQRDGRPLEDLPERAIIGTSSLRRRGQARAVSGRYRSVPKS